MTSLAVSPMAVGLSPLARTRVMTEAGSPSSIGKREVMSSGVPVTYRVQPACS